MSIVLYNDDDNNNKDDDHPQNTTDFPYQEICENANLFTETLQNLHASFGTRFMVPTLGGKALDLHRLFVEVTARGGLEKVIRNRQWKEIIAIFSFPPTITNASFVLRKYYLSLLHQYEQVYFFRKQSPPAKVNIQAAAPPTEEKIANGNHLPGSQLWTGRWVTGTMDGKFENGYIVTMSFGCEKLKGVLYHVGDESQELQSCNSSLIDRPRNRKKAWLKKSRDPTRPKPNRSGYNFFYSEHYSRLKCLYRGQEKTISTRVAQLWSNLSDAEKHVYQEKGLRDKERYKSEMAEYEQSGILTPKTC